MLALAAYVARVVWDPAAVYSTRSFGLADRLYTEARVLWDYADKILLPRPRSLGLYFDDYPLAAPPWRSATTALAIAGWVAAFAGALAGRRRAPALSFAILWF